MTIVKLNHITRALLQQNIGKRTLCASALLTALTAPVFAQDDVNAQQADAGQDVAQAVDTSNVEVIKVSGMRATMTRSLNEKRNTAAVVDAIAAADFGDLPGLSISDVIENITSVSGHRGKGSASEMSIRGMGPFLGYSTFNERTVTSAGYTRAVNFKKFPSDLVDKVVVYKSQQANLIEGGVSGTIALSSLRPLDYGENVGSIELTGIYNETEARVDGENGLGNRATFSYVDQFETDFGAFGYTIGGQRTDSSNPEESLLTSSTLYACATNYADGSPVDIRSASDCEDGDGAIDRDNVNDYDPDSQFFVPSSTTYRTMEESDERNAIVGTLQWQPNDNWDIYGDFEWSRNEYTEDRHDLTVSDGRRYLDNVVTDGNRTLEYRTGESKFEAQGYYRDEIERYNGFGLKIDHYMTDALLVSLDLSYSRSHRNRSSFQSRIKTGDRWNYSLDQRQHRLTRLRFLDENGLNADQEGFDSSTAFNPTNPESWLGVNNNGTNPEARYRRQMDERFDTIKAARFDVNYAIENNDWIASVDAGIRYSEEHLTSDLDTNTAIDPNTGERVSEYKTTNVDETTPLIENCFLPKWNNDEWFKSENGDGVEGGEYAQFDGRCGFGLLSQANPDGSFTDIGRKPDTRSNGDDDIREDITAGYVMVNLDGEAFDTPVTGNVGLRVVHTSIEAKGYTSEFELVTTVDPDTGTEYIRLEEVDGGTVGTHYVDHSSTEYLPSANITFHLDDDLLLRTAAYRALSRPNLQDLGAGRSVNVADDDNITDPDDLIDDASGDNPTMEPLMSWNGDISLEWYPNEDTALSVALYYKQFEASFKKVNLTEYLTVDGVEYPMSVSTTEKSDDTSDLKGIEISAQKVFTELPAPFDTLGTKLSYNYADSDFENQDGTFGDVTNDDGTVTEGFVDPANIFGFSKNTFSGSVYWDYRDFSVRVLYKTRSQYFQPNSGAKANRYVEPFEYVDMNAKYKFTKNTALSLKVLNVLDEAQFMTRGGNDTPTLISSTGTKYFVSLKHKF
nr:TonB-dependent receptor [Echinimonas agarilytica]